MLLGPGPESAPRSAFWAILGTCLGVPQRVLFGSFLAFLGPKTAKKHSKSTLWGTPRQVPKIAQKALRGALSGPGPKSTPVNGGRDRKVMLLNLNWAASILKDVMRCDRFWHFWPKFLPEKITLRDREQVHLRKKHLPRQNKKCQKVGRVQHTHKEHRANVLNVMNFRVFSGYFRGVSGVAGCFSLCAFRVCPLDPLPRKWTFLNLAFYNTQIFHR